MRKSKAELNVSPFFARKNRRKERGEVQVARKACNLAIDGKQIRPFWKSLNAFAAWFGHLILSFNPSSQDLNPRYTCAPMGLKTVVHLGLFRTDDKERTTKSIEDAPMKSLNTVGLLALALTIASPCFHYAKADISDINGLSGGALGSLVAHYDGRQNVNTTGNVVDSWTPIDGFGNALAGMTVTSTQRGNGNASLITYDGAGSLNFDDSVLSPDGRYLSGALANNGSTDFTVFWLGHYRSGAPFEDSGTYSFNIGSGSLAHQRDDSSTGFAVELFNGSTFAGDDITAFDGTNTIWSTVVTANSHTAWADGTNLNVGGSPNYNIGANSIIEVGAFGASGFDFVGEMQQLLIFESALNDTDRMLVEGYLTSTAIPEPGTTCLLGSIGIGMLARRRKSD